MLDLHIPPPPILSPVLTWNLRLGWVGGGVSVGGCVWGGGGCVCGGGVCVCLVGSIMGMGCVILKVDGGVLGCVSSHQSTNHSGLVISLLQNTKKYLKF